MRAIKALATGKEQKHKQRVKLMERFSRAKKVKAGAHRIMNGKGEDSISV